MAFAQDTHISEPEKKKKDDDHNGEPQNNQPAVFAQDTQIGESAEEQKKRE